ncbi:MAG: hypothetical protein J6386_11605 [Candidatus Synoicihabitans palmerolidicus]|nr:hypothetical protein [Candidatus Synoicihabitans palmerolidicus]
MVLAALKGGRVPVELQQEAAEMLAPVRAEARDATAWQGMQAAARADAGVREAMEAVVTQQLALRQQFASGQHSEVVIKCRELDPRESGDETVLLATLASAVVKDGGEWARWSEEIVRRNPQPEVVAWIGQIRRETGM